MFLRRKGLLALTVALGLASASAFAAPGPPQTPGLEHALIASYAAGAKLAVTAIARGEVDWMTLYYRSPGIKAFQAKPMAKASGAAVFACELDTSTLAGDGFEYYIEAEKGDRKVAVPAGGAAEPALVKLEGADQTPRIPESLPSPQAEEAKLKLPVHANGNVQGLFQEDASGTPMTNPTGNGNVQIGFEAGSAGQLGMRLDSNFSLTNAPPALGRSVNLSNMMLSLTAGSHALRMGDININESEYTSFGLGRRGIEYAFDNRKIYLHAFDVSSQQIQGFKGFGVPAGAVSILGGAAGFRLFGEALSFRAVFVTGRDDPSQAANATASPYLQPRKGDAWSVLQETSLFRNALRLKAEFARSSYDADTADEVEETSDGAWSTGANLALGPLSLGAVYRFIGRNFNSIGLQFLANDRRGADANLLIAAGPLSLQGQLMSQRDNVEDDPERPTTDGLSGNASLNLALGSKLSLSGGFRFSNQESRQGADVDVLQDAATREFSGGFNWMAASAFSLNVTLAQSSLSSKTNPSGDIQGTTLNLGLSIRAGETLLLSPTVGLTRSKNLASGAVDTTLNAFLNGEVFFVPRVLSLLLTGSFNRMAMAVVSVNKTIDLIGGVNFYLGKLIKVNSLLLTVKANYRRSEYGGAPVTDTRIIGQADFAF